MRRTIPGPHPGPTCWDCGATNAPGAAECWLCRRRDWDKPPAVRPEHHRPASPRNLPGIACGIALIALAGVAVGIWRDASGLAIALVVLVLPALLITEVKARKRQGRGEPMSLVDRITSVVLLTIFMPALLAAALFVAVGLFCLYVIYK